MKYLKIVFLALGVYLLVVTVQSVGVPAILENLSRLRWKFLVIVLAYVLVYLANTEGWIRTFPHPLAKSVPFWDIFSIRVVGETLNVVIPWAASVGGEPVKAELMRRRHGVPLSETFASVLIVHTSYFVSLNTYIIGGLLVSYQVLPLTPVLRQVVFIFLVGLSVVTLFLIFGLYLGFFRSMHKLGEKFRWWHGDRAKEKKERYLALDENIRLYYTANRRRFFGSVFFNFLAWSWGAFETYLVLNWLGVSVTPGEAWMLDAAVQVVRIGTFFIPSSLGAQEGGIVFIFSQLGFAAPVSLTFAVVRRMREIVWIAVGLALWGLLRDKKTA